MNLLELKEKDIPEKSKYILKVQQLRRDALAYKQNVQVTVAEEERKSRATAKKRFGSAEQARILHQQKLDQETAALEKEKRLHEEQQKLTVERTNFMLEEEKQRRQEAAELERLEAERKWEEDQEEKKRELVRQKSEQEEKEQELIRQRKEQEKKEQEMTKQREEQEEKEQEIAKQKEDLLYRAQLLNEVADKIRKESSRNPLNEEEDWVYGAKMEEVRSAKKSKNCKVSNWGETVSVLLNPREILQ